MTPLRRAVKRTAAAAGILLFAAGVTGYLVVQSGWFRERVRERIVSVVEDATGGRVELGSWSFDWTGLTFTISPFVLHGTEPAGEAPLVYVESVTLGLRLISAVEQKVDLAYLRVEQPRVRIVIYPDGTDNLPTPKRGGARKSWAQNVVDLAVRRYDVNGGVAEVGVRRVPLEFRGEDLAIRMDYDTRAPRYTGELTARRLRTSWKEITPVEFDTSATFALTRSRLEFERLRLATGHSRFDLKGFLGNLRAPVGSFDVRSIIALPDVVPLFSLPIAPIGSATFDGKLMVSFLRGFDYSVSGRASAQGLQYTRDRLKIAGADVRATLDVVPGRVTLKDVDLDALGAKFAGDVQLVDQKDLTLTGTFDGLSVSEAANVLTDRPIPWSGSMIGSVSLTSSFTKAFAARDTKLEVMASIIPSPSGRPIEGAVHVRYDQLAGTVELGDSNFSTPGTTVNVNGTLGQTLNVRARTNDLDDVLRLIAVADGDAPTALPLQLNGGEVELNGAVTGTVAEPRFRGSLEIGKASIIDRAQGHAFDRLVTQVDATRRSVALSRLTIARGATQISGDIQLAARAGVPADDQWTDGALGARLDVRNAVLADLAKEFGIKEPLSGTASANVRLSGTPRVPEANVDFDIARAAAMGEEVDRLRGSLRYAPRVIELRGVEADLGTGKMMFSGSYNHAPDDWKNGDVKLEASSQGLAFARIAALRGLQPGLDTKLDGNVSVEAAIQAGRPLLHVANGAIAARGTTFGNDMLGDVTITAQTKDNNLALQAALQLRGTGVQLQGNWRLEGDMPGSGTAKISRMSIAALHDLVMLDGTDRPKPINPVDGFLEASATFSVPLAKPELFQAEVKIETVQLNAPASQALRLGVQTSDVVLRNTQPIVVNISAKEAQIHQGRFSARNTDLEVSGTIPFEAKRGADLAVKGNVNLVILQLLNPDLLATGSAEVAVTVRGSLRDPQLNGRMTLNSASLYLADVPSGIDSANGVILFDRNRATIGSLTAETGGGMVSLKGFVEFADTLIYRLQADVRQVRVRYPADVSTTANGQLSLNGTPATSTLSGSLTVNRASVATGADFARIIASTVTPSPGGGAESEYLRGLRFDVHIESSPTFEFETSLTRNVQASVDLRLRGTPDRPSLLGDISVSSGEVQLFGNRYTVNRGDIRFLNPVKIEPTLDINMETRTRGITVNVSLSGSPQRLTINYSSDPPLQSREIIALLAVGRDPSATTRVTDTAGTGSSDFGAAGGLLGQAVSEQLNNRLQRFFGASRVKIDPTLTGVTNLPEARLTLEQQVSRDITLTYITNLNRTTEQVVRVQWDLSQQWSAVAVRDTNGLFGIDILYRRRFK
jgi:translocation and assembly module TamB